MKRLLASLLTPPKPDRATPQAVVAAQLKYVPTYQAVRPSIEAELRRARRYERPLAVVVATLDHPAFATASSEPSGNAGAVAGQPMPEDSDEADKRRALFDVHASLLLLGDLLQGSVRETDIVAYAPARHRFVVCLPECDGESASLAVERVGRLFRERTAHRLLAGVAAYPPDALIVDDLIAQAVNTLAAPFPAPSLTIVRHA
jgi:hypothetical protein